MSGKPRKPRSQRLINLLFIYGGLQQRFYFFSWYAYDTLTYRFWGFMILVLVCSKSNSLCGFFNFSGYCQPVFMFSSIIIFSPFMIFPWLKLHVHFSMWCNAHTYICGVIVMYYSKIFYGKNWISLLFSAYISHTAKLTCEWNAEIINAFIICINK